MVNVALSDSELVYCDGRKDCVVEIVEIIVSLCQESQCLANGVEMRQGTWNLSN
jgi:hypothetical protein